MDYDVQCCPNIFQMKPKKEWAKFWTVIDNFSCSLTAHLQRNIQIWLGKQWLIFQDNFGNSQYHTLAMYCCFTFKISLENLLSRINYQNLNIYEEQKSLFCHLLEEQAWAKKLASNITQPEHPLFYISTSLILEISGIHCCLQWRLLENHFAILSVLRNQCPFFIISLSEDPPNLLSVH